MRYRLAIFDFDGTLSDSLVKITGVTNRALSSFGLPERSIDDVRPLVGLPLSEVLGRLSGGREVDALCDRYRELWDNRSPAPLFDGVVEMLDELANADVRLAIATSRKREGLATMLAIHGLGDRFASLVGGGCTEMRKPHPAPVYRVLDQCGVPAQESVVVGDTTYDMEMGSGAGADTCAVTYGAHPLQDLERTGPTHVAHSVGDVMSAIRGR